MVTENHPWFSTTVAVTPEMLDDGRDLSPCIEEAARRLKNQMERLKESGKILRYRRGYTVKVENDGLLAVFPQLRVKMEVVYSLRRQTW